MSSSAVFRLAAAKTIMGSPAARGMMVDDSSVKLSTTGRMNRQMVMGTPLLQLPVDYRRLALTLSRWPQKSFASVRGGEYTRTNASMRSRGSYGISALCHTHPGAHCSGHLDRRRSGHGQG